MGTPARLEQANTAAMNVKHLRVHFISVSLSEISHLGFAVSCLPVSRPTYGLFGFRLQAQFRPIWPQGMLWAREIAHILPLL
jgi:hypothetical protein